MDGTRTRSGRLRLTEVTGDVLQTGGEVWLDAPEVTIGGYATLTLLELHPDLDESILYTGGMDVSNLELGDGLVWAEGLSNSIHLVRMSDEQEDTAEPIPDPRLKIQGSRKNLQAAQVGY